MSGRNNKDGSDLGSTVARSWADLRVPQERAECENKGMCDDVYYINVHVPCVAICPKCQSEEWDERKKGGTK